jgi:uncharacterized protein (TIGR02145 family)
MSNSDKNDNSLIHVGSTGLTKVNNALRITENLLSSFDSVVIGEQEWMTRNLNVSKFRNGDIIPEIQDPEEWAKAGTEKKPAWCYYYNEPKNGKIYGKLYNWHAVNDPRGFTPIGWRVPDVEDVEVLIEFIGGWDYAGHKLKAVVKQPPVPPLEAEVNDESTNDSEDLLQEYFRRHREKERNAIIEFCSGNNESGFTALSAGYRFYLFDEHGSNCYFSQVGIKTGFWSSTEDDSINALILELNSDGHEASCFPSTKGFGYSVRCLKR